MDVLWEVFRKNKSQMPSRKERIKLAESLGFKENQIYKWFWEIHVKYREEAIAEQVSHDLINELSDQRKFEVFVNRQLKHYRSNMELKGSDKNGRRLTEDEIMAFVKIFVNSKEQQLDYEALAEEMNYDLDGESLKVINCPNDPDQFVISIEQKPSSEIDGEIDESGDLLDESLL